jgi:3-isopropylmalate/(R)-2-methylmalate dehydratase small subunit
MPQFNQITSTAVVLAENDIDTDQIIPARFLKVTDKNGLGDNLFADWRYLPDGSPRPDFPLNQPAARQAQVLFSGHNFGCGSSREHAPWALTGFGFQAVIASSFADIFRNNALKNGLLPVELEPDAHQKLQAQLTSRPDMPLTIDLESQTVTTPHGESWSFPIDGFSKTCLIKGVDELGYLLAFADQIGAYEAQL